MLLSVVHTQLYLAVQVSVHMRIVFLLKSRTLTESVCESADWLTIVGGVPAPVL